MPKDKKKKHKSNQHYHPHPFRRTDFNYASVNNFQPRPMMSNWFMEYSRPRTPAYFPNPNQFFPMERYCGPYQNPTIRGNNFNDPRNAPRHPFPKKRENFGRSNSLNESGNKKHETKEERLRKSVSPPVIEKNDKASTAVRDKLSEIISGHQVITDNSESHCNVSSSSEKQTVESSYRTSSHEYKGFSQHLTPILDKFELKSSSKGQSSACSSLTDDRREDVLVRAEALCKTMRDRRAEKALELAEKESAQRKVKENELQAEIEKLTDKSLQNVKGIISSDSLRSSVLSLKQARRELDQNTLSTSILNSMESSGSVSPSPVSDMMGKDKSPLPPNKKYIEKHVRSPLTHGKMNLSKTELIKLIESPRTRKEEIILEALLKQHRKLKSYKERQHILMKGAEQSTEGTGKNIEVEDLPEEIQIEISELLENEGSNFESEIMGLLSVKEETAMQTSTSADISCVPSHTSSVTMSESCNLRGTQVEGKASLEEGIYTPPPLIDMHTFSETPCDSVEMLQANSESLSSVAQEYELSKSASITVPKLGKKVGPNLLGANGSTCTTEKGRPKHNKPRKKSIKKKNETYFDKNVDQVGKYCNSIHTTNHQKHDIVKESSISGKETDVDQLVKSLTIEIKNEMKSECLPFKGVTLTTDKCLKFPTKEQPSVSIVSSTSSASTLPLTVADLSVPESNLYIVEQDFPKPQVESKRDEQFAPSIEQSNIINVEPDTCEPHVSYDTTLESVVPLPPIVIDIKESAENYVTYNTGPVGELTSLSIPTSDTAQGPCVAVLTDTSSTCMMDTDALMSKRSWEPTLDEESKRLKINEKGPQPDSQLNQIYSIALEEDKIHEKIKENDESIKKLEEMLRKTQEQLKKKKDIRQSLLDQEEDLRKKRLSILKGAIESCTSASLGSGDDIQMNLSSNLHLTDTPLDSGIINVEPDTTVEIVPALESNSLDIVCKTDESKNIITADTDSCCSASFKKPKNQPSRKGKKNKSSTGSESSLGSKIKSFSVKIDKLSDNGEECPKKPHPTNKQKKKKTKSDRDKQYTKSKNVDSSNSESYKKPIKKIPKRSDISAEVLDYLHASSSTDIEWGDSKKGATNPKKLKKPKKATTSKLSSKDLPMNIPENVKLFGMHDESKLTALLCDGDYVFTGGLQKIKKWTLKGTVLWTKSLPSALKEMALFKDTSESTLLVLCGNDKNTCKLLTIQSESEEPTIIELEKKDFCRATMLTVNWELLFAVNAANAIMVYKRNKIRNKIFRLVNTYVMTKSGGRVTCLATAEYDGKKMLLAGLENGSIVCRSAMTGTFIRMFENHPDSLSHLQVVDNYVYSLCRKQLLLHELQNGNAVQRFMNPCSTFFVNNGKLTVATVNGEIWTFTEEFEAIKICNLPGEAEEIKYLSSYNSDKIICARMNGAMWIVDINKGQSVVCKYGRCTKHFAQKKDLSKHLVQDHLLGSSSVKTCLWQSCRTPFKLNQNGGFLLCEAKEHLIDHVDHY